MRVDTRSEMLKAFQKYQVPSGEIPDALPISIISVNDDMFHNDADSYFRIGLQAEQIISNSLDNSRNPRILVLPSGHGRETRFLKYKFPDAELIACDLEQDAIDFCEKVFGCIPLLSNERFSNVNFPKDCDLIWMGSLITHISENRTVELLNLLVGCLKIGGSLIISSHGKYVADLLATGPGYGLDHIGTDLLNRDYLGSGYGYANYPNQDNYGISVIKTDWFKEFFGNLALSFHLEISERIWDNHHDIISFKLQ